eukprot:TRINITY_DN106063_c0_g1_i1.p1 TRINITY_DN106063_c0_g1~~TRINITY_DN106063_c0_g1_i1.p1  ORF type:complete len:501 (-),score=9.39 TRINITY_DN106063_c0_g1_i1:87-1589(-)
MGSLFSCPARERRRRRPSDTPENTTRVAVPVGSSSPIDVPSRDPRTWALSGGGFGMSLLVGTVSPVLPVFATSLGISQPNFGFIAAAGGVGRLVMVIPSRVAADTFGRRWIMIVMPIAAASCQFGSLWAESTITLVLWRSLSGIATCAFWTAATLYGNEISHLYSSHSADDGHDSGLPYFRVAVILGIISSPLLGGLIAQEWGLTRPFLVSAICGATVGGLSLVFLAHDPPPQTQHNFHSLRLRQAITLYWNVAPPLLRKSDGMKAAILINMFLMGSATGGHAYISIFCVSQFGVSLVSLGGLMCVLSAVDIAMGYPVASFLLSNQTNCCNKRSLMEELKIPLCAGLFMSSFSMVQIVWSSSFQSVVVWSAMWAAGQALSSAIVQPYAYTFAQQEQDPENEDDAPWLPTVTVGILRTTGALGMLIVPVMLGAVIATSTLRTALMSHAVVYSLGGLLFAVVPPSPVRAEGITRDTDESMHNQHSNKDPGLVIPFHPCFDTE